MIKKKTLLLALLFISANTYADVKLIGGLQAEVANISGDTTGTKGFAIGDTTSGKENYGYLGVKWEDGDVFGKARFRINISENNQGNPDAAAIGTRDMYIGMQLADAKLLAGTFASAYKVTGGKNIDPFYATGLQAREKGGGMSDGQSDYITAISYRTKMAGLNIKMDYAPSRVFSSDATKTTTTGEREKISFGVSMDFGDVTAFFAVDDFKSDTAGEKATKLGAKVKISNARLAAQIEANQKKYDSALADTTTFVSVSVPVGGVTFASWLGINKDTSLAIGIQKALSRKSMVYTGYRNTGHGSGKSTSVFLAGLRTAF